jgi:lipopolysaccharide export LptBFGC system permease protein LptF
VLNADTRRPLAMILSYLASGFAFGLGLLLFTIGGSGSWPLIVALWLAAIVLMIANYRRGRR